MIPGWEDQRIQFLTRYLFGILGVIYFNFVFEYNSPWLSLGKINVMLSLYFIWLTSTFVHAYFRNESIPRFRLAMWVDILLISIIVICDPFLVPLTSMVYIVIVLGNGMRYGMRCFSEALLGSFLAAMLSLTLRYSGSLDELTPGVIFLNMFGGIILVYAYILMSRIDATRRVMEQSSRVDSLTGLSNRAALEKGANEMLAGMGSGNSTISLMFADVDNFSTVNESLGHAEGDRVLREVAKIFRNNIRDVDIAGRYGGDEFVILLRDTPIAEAKVVAERIQNELQTWAKESALDISISIGIGESPTHSVNFKHLLALAYRALSHGKAINGNGSLSIVASGE